jgi:hypothetical protein
MRQWQIYPNREVIVRRAGDLIMWWIYGTLIAFLLHARGAPYVWSDYVFGWICVAFFIAACVLSSPALAILKLLLFALRHDYRSSRPSRRLPAGHCDDENRVGRFCIHIPPGCRDAGPAWSYAY